MVNVAAFLSLSETDRVDLHAPAGHDAAPFSQAVN